jgi:hypothetical protein
MSAEFFGFWVIVDLVYRIGKLSLFFNYLHLNEVKLFDFFIL